MTAIASDITYTEGKKEKKKKGRKGALTFLPLLIIQEKAFLKSYRDTSTSHWPEPHRIALPRCDVGGKVNLLTWG